MFLSAPGTCVGLLFVTKPNAPTPQLRLIWETRDSNVTFLQKTGGTPQHNETRLTTMYVQTPTRRSRTAAPTVLRTKYVCGNFGIEKTVQVDYHDQVRITPGIDYTTKVFSSFKTKQKKVRHVFFFFESQTRGGILKPGIAVHRIKKKQMPSFFFCNSSSGNLSHSGLSLVLTLGRSVGRFLFFSCALKAPLCTRALLH